MSFMNGESTVEFAHSILGEQHPQYMEKLYLVVSISCKHDLPRLVSCLQTCYNLTGAILEYLFTSKMLDLLAMWSHSE